MHSTNYTNTLILPSEDCAAVAKVPVKPDSVAGLQYAQLQQRSLTSDELLVAVTAARRDVPANAHAALRAELFSKGQPCLRASPLIKTHGWAVYHDTQARVTLIDPRGADFAKLVADEDVTKVAGMRSRRQ